MIDKQEENLQTMCPFNPMKQRSMELGEFGTSQEARPTG